MFRSEIFALINMADPVVFSGTRSGMLRFAPQQLYRTYTRILYLKFYILIPQSTFPEYLTRKELSHMTHYTSRASFHSAPIRIGVHAASYRISSTNGLKRITPDRMGLHDFIDHAFKSGVDGVELDTAQIKHLDYDGLAALRERLRGRNLQPVLSDAATATATNEPGQQQLYRLAAHLHAAQLLGAHVLSLHLALPGAAGSSERQDSLRRWIELFDCLMPVAKTTGITLGIVSGYDLHTAEIERIVQAVASPQLGITLDLCGRFGTREEQHDMVLRLLPYAVNIYFRNYRFSAATPSCCSIFDGVIDMCKTVDLVQAAGRSLQVSAFVPPDNLNAGTLMHEYLHFLKTTFGQVSTPAA